MATARERLLQVLSSIIDKPFDNEGEIALKRILKSYRVQSKPEEIVNKSFTARDELAKRIISLWVDKPLDRKELIKIFFPFRMQLKQGLKNAKIRLQNLAAKDALDPSFSNIQANNSVIKKANKHENAYFDHKTKETQKNAGSEPIAGGPRKKSSLKGQCPKCRSLGIVLAPSYLNDSHYSCVYCGYHVFIGAKEAELDLPFAAQILGKFFDDQEE